MVLNLLRDLPRLLPGAIAWALAREKEILHTGSPLDNTGLAIARAVGVMKPEEIRISRVLLLPLPEEPGLRQAALMTGLLGSSMVGLTLGYGIYICNGHESPSLISHECRHVYQYEQAGSIASYLPVYLQQIVTVGYANAPFEMDARSHERRSA